MYKSKKNSVLFSPLQSSSAYWGTSGATPTLEIDVEWFPYALLTWNSRVKPLEIIIDMESHVKNASISLDMGSHVKSFPRAPKATFDMEFRVKPFDIEPMSNLAWSFMSKLYVRGGINLTWHPMSM